MAKPKDTPSLFEIMKSAESQAQPAEGAGQHAAASAGSRPEPELPRVSVPLGGSGPPASVEPLMRTEGERIRFSLNTLSLALVIFAVLLLLVVAFEVGRQTGKRSGRTAQADVLRGEISPGLQAAAEQEPDPGVLQDLELVERETRVQSANNKRPSQDDDTGRLVGLNYLWIETFNATDEAENAQAFLLHEGVDSTVYRLASSGKWVLISSAGFDLRNAQQREACEQLQQRIRVVGERYADAGGRYRFHGCYPRLKKADDGW